MPAKWKDCFKGIFEDSGFSPEKLFLFDQSKLRCSVMGKIGNVQCFLKIVKLSDARVQRYKKEYQVEKLFCSNAKNGNDIARVQILNDGENLEYYWLIRKFYPGNSLSSYSNQKKPLFGYDLITRRYSKKVDILKPIINNIRVFKKIQKGGPLERELPMYVLEMDDKLISGIEKGINLSLEKQLNFIITIKHDYLDGVNTCASMGDLTPANIIITKSNEVLLSDFEWFSFDNYMMDTAHLWLFLWRYPRWQKELFSAMVASNKAEDFFRVSLIRIILGWYKAPFTGDNPIHSSASRKKYFTNHIWTKYLEAAGDSFEALMKVKK